MERNAAGKESGQAAKPCPKCGKTPIVTTTLFGTFYVICHRHAETVACKTKEEAIALWNAGKFEN